MDGPHARRRELSGFNEVKHDGFRVIARKDDERVTLYSRPGHDLTKRFPADHRCTDAAAIVHDRW
jgi:ATP-dependent DNA ligase